MYLEYPDGLYVPTRYYLHPQQTTQVVLIGTLHVGEKSFYKQVNATLRECERVIYEELRVIDTAVMEQREKDCRAMLEAKGTLDESFLAAIFLPMPPSKFSNDHGLVQEVRSFNYAQDHWISGDGAWDGNASEDGALSDNVWKQIRNAIKILPAQLKREKVKAAKKFLHSVDAGSASIQEYISFCNLHEEEIEAKINKHTLVDPRDKLTFDVFDKVIETQRPSCVAIKFGNAHIPGLDRELRSRNYSYIATMWLRILKIE